MAVKKVIYKEPKGYFNADMLKAAKEWDAKHPQESKQTASKSKQGTKPKK